MQAPAIAPLEEGRKGLKNKVSPPVKCNHGVMKTSIVELDEDIVIGNVVQIWGVGGVEEAANREVETANKRFVVGLYHVTNVRNSLPGCRTWDSHDKATTWNLPENTSTC